MNFDDRLRKLNQRIDILISGQAKLLTKVNNLQADFDAWNARIEKKKARQPAGTSSVKPTAAEKKASDTKAKDAADSRALTEAKFNAIIKAMDDDLKATKLNRTTSEAARQAMDEIDGTGIKWRAAADPKWEYPTLFYFTADWCAPCQVWMRDTLSQTEVADYINSYSYPVKADLTHIDIREIENETGLRSLPAIVVEFDGKQEILDDPKQRRPGAEETIKWLRQALLKVKPLKGK